MGTTPSTVGRIILGVAGKAGAGKDTLADELVKNHGFFKASFALALKLEVMQKLGFTREEVFETKPPHVRKVLQEYGQAMRDADPEFWIRKLERYIEGKRAVVIPDVRYINEVAAIERWGGKVIRILHADRPYPLAGTPAATHPSETELDAVALPNVWNTKASLPADLARAGLSLSYPHLITPF